MVTSAETNLVNTVIADHRLLDRVLTELQDQSLTGQWRRALVDHVTAELVAHLVAEEHYLYPLLRAHVDLGADLADHELDEHRQVETLLQQLEELDGDDPRLSTGLTELSRRVRDHMAEEEDTVLPAVGAACSPLVLQKYGAKMLHNKQFAPTHPHPGAPNRPPGNLFVDPGAGFLDRIRDHFRTTDA